MQRPRHQLPPGWVGGFALVVLVGCWGKPTDEGHDRIDPKSVREYTPGGRPGVKLEIRLAEDSPTAGTTPVALDDGSWKVYVHSEVLFGNADIAKTRSYSWTFEGEPQWAVGLHLTPVAADRMATLTRANLGNRMAILLDGKAILAPKIAAPIERGEVEIGGGMNQDEADRLARQLVGEK